MLYNPLIGEKFQATYLYRDDMPQMGNPRDVLMVQAETSQFAAKLQQISSAVLGQWGSQVVWKGFTGPNDSPDYTNYRLWVEPALSGQMPPEYTCNFMIKKVTFFLCYTGTFSCGMSLLAVPIP